MKKRFQCGHKGLGKVCHRCAQAEHIAAQLPAMEKTLADLQGDGPDPKILRRLETLQGKRARVAARSPRDEADAAMRAADLHEIDGEILDAERRLYGSRTALVAEQEGYVTRIRARAEALKGKASP